MTKPIEFLGDSLDELRGFPREVRRTAGFQLDRVRHGLEPNDWRPMKNIGHGAREIRVRVASGVFRVIYVTKFEEAVFVLHCFQKKTEKTAKADLDLATEGTDKEVQLSDQKFNNVWDAIEDTPREAASLKVRSELMMALQQHLKSSGMTQVRAAELFGVTQPRVSDLMRGRVELFSIDALIDMLTSLGLRVELNLKAACDGGRP